MLNMKKKKDKTIKGGDNLTAEQGETIKRVIQLIIDIWVALTGGKKDKK